MNRLFRIRFLIAGPSVLVIAIAACLFLPFSSNEEPAAIALEARTPELPDVPDGTTLDVSTDPELVFKKALWRRPGAEDNVVHAERLEWTNESGEVVKWQWFLVVEPSAATRKWLAGNPFALTPGSIERDSQVGSYRPEWFPAELARHDLLESPDGRHQLAISRDGKWFYGTDSGFGFAPSDTVGGSTALATP